MTGGLGRLWWRALGATVSWMVLCLTPVLADDATERGKVILTLSESEDIRDSEALDSQYCWGNWKSRPYGLRSEEDLVKMSGLCQHKNKDVKIRLCTQWEIPDRIGFSLDIAGECLKGKKFRRQLEGARWVAWLGDELAPMNIVKFVNLSGKPVLFLSGDMIGRRESSDQASDQERQPDDTPEQIKHDLIVESLPVKPNADMDVAVLVGCEGPEVVRLPGKVKAGTNKAVIPLPPDHISTTVTAECRRFAFGENNYFDQSGGGMKGGDPDYTIKLRWKSFGVKFQDGISKKMIKLTDVALAPRMDVCKPTVEGGKIKFLEGCSRLVAAAPNYRPKEIDLAKKPGIVTLEPSSVSAKVEIAEQLKDLKFELAGVPDPIVLTEGQTITVPGDSIRDRKGDVASVDILVEGHPAKARLESRGGQAWLSPSFHWTIDIRAKPCPQSDMVAIVDLALNADVTWKVEDVRTGDQVPFIYGVGHSIAIRADGFKVLNATDSPKGVFREPTRDWKVWLAAEKLSRQFQIVAAPLCDRNSSKGMQGALIDLYPSRPLAIGDQGIFSLPLPSETEDVKFKLRGATKSGFVFRETESDSYAVEDWDQDGDVCELQKVELVPREGRRSFKLTELAACSETREGSVVNESVAFRGRTAKSNGQGKLQVFGDLLWNSTEVKMAPDSIYEIVRDVALNATRRSAVDLGKWSSPKVCGEEEILLRRKKQAGARQVPILDLGEFSPTLSSLEHVDVRIRNRCPGHTPRDLKKDLLGIEDDGRVVLRPSSYTTMDREVIVSSRGYEEYEPFSRALPLDSDQQQNPIRLNRRLPGVMLVVSATSTLEKAYFELINPLVDFLVEETELNSKVAVARSFGRDFYEPIELSASGKQEAIRKGLSSLTIDSGANPDPVQDLSNAQEALLEFNDDVAGYRNRLFYIVPSATDCGLIRPEEIEEYLKAMDVTVVEIWTEAWRAGVCLNVPGLTHHYVKPEEFPGLLTSEAQEWRN